MKEKCLEIKQRVIEYFRCLLNDIKSINKSNIFEIVGKRVKLLMMIGLLIFLATGYFFGRNISSESKVLSTLEIALKSGDIGKLRSVVRVDGKKVDKDKLEPIINYYKNDSSMVDTTVKALKSGRETGDFSIKEEKKLIGSNYYVKIKTYSVKVISNFDKAEFSMASLENIKAYSSFKNVYPGLYTINGKLESEYGDIEKSKDIVVMKNEEVSIEFPAILVTVTSTFDDGEIYVNGENTNIKVGDKKEIGPLSIDGSVKMHVEKEFPWGRIKGEEVAVRDIPNVKLDISMENEAMKENILSKVREFYNSVFNALNTEDKNDIKGSTDKTKDKIYSILEEKYFFLKNKYTVKTIDIVEDRSQYLYSENKYRATIVVNVDYEVSKNFLGLNRSDEKKSFFTRLYYDNGSWIVEDVENFSL